MKPNWVTELQKENKQTAVICAGGGSRFISELNAYGGSSKICSFASFLNSTEHTDNFLGYQPYKYVSEQTALDLAMKGFMQQAEVLGMQENIQAIACTAKLATTNEREGRKHKVCIAKQTVNSTVYQELEFVGSSTREGEEYLLVDVLSQFLINNIYLVNPYYRTMYTINHYKYESANTFEYNRNAYLLMDNRLVFAGSFNPMHYQHMSMVEWAEKMYGRPVEFLLSLRNFGKIWTNFKSLTERTRSIRALAGNRGIIVRDSPLYYEKMKYYTNSTFLVGSDNLDKLAAVDYDKLVDIINKNNNRLLIFPRQGYIITEEWRRLPFVDVAYDYVDDGTSSTKIRNSEV